VTDEILTDPITRDTSRKGNYLSRHWRGQLSLAVAFWVNYIVLSVIFFVTGNILALNEADDGVGIPFLMIWLPIIIWQCVGTWRSAGNRGGFWGVAVKGCVAIGILETAVGYAILFT
jgi:hypothetical protein